MSILIDSSTRILAQGIKGRRSMMAIRSSIDYGSNIVAGVSFGMGGEQIYGVPVYNTVRGAAKNHEIDASVIFSHGSQQVKQEVIEACKAGIKLIVLLEEKIPLHDLAEILAICRDAGSMLLGPNSNGIISVGKSKVGTIGGSEPNKIFSRGDVGIVSRSVGMASELGYLLKKHSVGVSTCVTMGSNAIVGTRMKDLVKMFLADEETNAILLCGMEGSIEEDECADFLLQESPSKPVICFISGSSLPGEARQKFLGCPTCRKDRGETTVEEKREKLIRAGAVVIERIEELSRVVSQYAIKIPAST